ncbi:hypothetical protein GDO86_013053 [Hymenochirus boettgeri]|uniref:C2H2-type domain-containing protein n=1 Tax=Hymenochirus boettgeri TaxID=247094 RepID=A0A8T2IWZ2_9PIPI|nr:hypothetical protein GDO86_013053 [Hymenochirus boettgeri]
MNSPEILSALSDASGLNMRELPVLPAENSLQVEGRFLPQLIPMTREHDFFEDGDVHRHLYIQDLLTSIGEVTERSKLSEFCCQTAGCTHVFDTLESYEHHYNTMHSNVCSTCKRSFPTARLLDIHILEWHDSLFQIMAEKGNMYQCLVEGCEEKFKASMDRKNHLIKIHCYPSDFRFNKTKKKKRKNKQECSPRKDIDMEVVIEEGCSMESMDECSLLPTDGTSNCLITKNRPLNNVHTNHKVPSTICFGHGSVRGFCHTKKKK